MVEALSSSKQEVPDDLIALSNEYKIQKKEGKARGHGSGFGGLFFFFFYKFFWGRGRNIYNEWYYNLTPSLLSSSFSIYFPLSPLLSSLSFVSFSGRGYKFDGHEEEKRTLAITQQKLAYGIVSDVEQMKDDDEKEVKRGRGD